MSEWETAGRRPRPTRPKANPKSDQAINQARRQGVPVETQQKYGGGTNKHQAGKNTAKLDRETEELKHDHVPLELGKLIMRARQEKQMSQKDLATKICEKPQIINDYEAGRGIPNNTIISKMERALGVKLRGKDRGHALPAAVPAAAPPAPARRY